MTMPETDARVDDATRDDKSEGVASEGGDDKHGCNPACTTLIRLDSQTGGLDLIGSEAWLPDRAFPGAARSICIDGDSN